MSSMTLDLRAPQKGTLIPEPFQQRLIKSMTGRLLAENPPPCLLRAPTGSGKTFVLLRTMSSVSSQRKVVWFWFVPFTTLVNQTLDAVVTNATDLTPTLFSHGVNQSPAAGQVLISTTQGVSRKAWRKAQYDAGGGEQERTPAEFVALCRGHGLQIGVIVDEAHIALDAATEFGHFVNWLNPDYLSLATATPRSKRINEFLIGAGMSNFEAFNVSRDDVVSCRLNKAYIQAVVYQLRESTATVADLKRTVLRQAWLRNQKLKSDLAKAGIPLTPLLLVQVENGKTSIEDAELDLVRLCGVPPQAIGKHSSDTPNPQMMDAIANDTSKEVLIFKQSAGTGFDAPRAFVLASLKSVNDPDFAMQFIGRVMRVSRDIRATYPTAEEIPAGFNTAYVYLANAEAQKGYQEAVQVTSAVRSALEGEVEKMEQRQTKGGATVFTNQPTQQPDLDYRTPLEDEVTDDQSIKVDDAVDDVEPVDLFPPDSDDFWRDGLTTDENGQTDLSFDEMDLIEPSAKFKTKPDPRSASSKEEWQRIMAERGISIYYMNRDAPKLPSTLKREDRPSIVNMVGISERVATQVDIPEYQRKEAILAALDRLRESERHTELTTRTVVSTQSVRIVVDRNVIAAEAKKALSTIKQIEPADHAIIVNTLAGRILPALKEELDNLDAEVEEIELQRMARTASQWLIRVLSKELEEALYAELATHSVTTEGDPLPDAMLFPIDIALPQSDKNIYEILPPSSDDLACVEQKLVLDDRALLRDQEWLIDGVPLKTGKFDNSFAMNKDELAFANALDRAPFVAWWFRNPDKKPYSVRLVRGEHRNYFYPDFLVCLSHVDGQAPKQRLIETKHDLKDARRKSRHVPEFYGKVLFLTQDNERLYVVTDEGGIGPAVDLGNMETIRLELQKTVP